MPIVKNLEGVPVTKTKPNTKIGMVTGKEKIAVKVAEISPKLKKNLNKITVVSKKIKVEKEKLKKKAPPKSKIIISPKVIKKIPRTSKKPKAKSPERKNDKAKVPLSPKPKKELKIKKEPKEPKKKITKTPKTAKQEDIAKKKVEISKESKKPDDNLKEPAEKPSKTIQKNDIPKPKVAKKVQEPKIKKESTQPKEPSALTKNQSIKAEETNTNDKNDKIKKAKPNSKVTVDPHVAERAIKTPKKTKTPNEISTKPKKPKHIEKIDETELINNIIQKVKEDVAKTIKKEKIIKTEPIENTETIAKLLKEANKTILKTARKKPDSIKLNKTNAIQKKPKAIPKKQKTVEIKQEYEEEVDLSELKQFAKALKAVKVIQKDTKNKSEETKKTDIAKKVELDKNHTDDSDELTLDVVRQNHKTESKTNAKDPKVTKKIKIEPSSDSEKKEKDKDKKIVKSVKKFKTKPIKKVISPKKKVVVLKKRLLKGRLKGLKGKDSSDDQVPKGKKIAKKLYNFWNGPKRHRVASLNAIAKVHCLYENESRGAMLDVMKRSVVPKETKEESVSSDGEPEPDPEPISEPTTRTLRSVPGLRGVGKHWEMNEDISSFSSDNESSLDGSTKLYTLPPSYKQKQTVKKEKKPIVKKEPKAVKKKQEKPQVVVEQEVEEDEEDDEGEDDEGVEVEKEKEASKDTKQKKKVVKKKRPRTELIMDLKDMVVRKRMASLNASAILAASYSVEKKPLRSPKTDDSNTSDSDDESIDSEVSTDKKRKFYDSDVKQEEDRKVIEVHASPNKKVAVILNQDTDVTITGVYVNSTTRSAHHEGYCSIAGMQYRISATSHTQTNATAVATETLLHSGTEHREGDVQPPRSYTPLSALSKMQPPGQHHGMPVGPVGSGDLSPGGRRHGCPSAFSAPPQVYGPPPPHHAPPHPHMHHRHGPIPEHPQPYIHGYYQPAGPLITAHHAHITAPLGPAPVVQQAPPPAPTQPVPQAKTIDATPSPTPPSQPPPTASAPSTGTNESSDNEVILTSATSGGSTESSSAPPPSSSTSQAPVYRYPPQYSGGYSQYPGYVTSGQYYQPAPPPHSMHYHDMCYPPPPGPYGPATYLHPKPYPTTFRRYLPPPTGQYYTSPPELYPPPSNQPSNQVVSAGASQGTDGRGGPGQGYQPPPGPPPTIVDTYAGPPPPTIVETYAPPPPAHYYSYGGSQPPCYGHSQPTRSLFIDPAYQSCPCPMQSCPKNVHTGPLTGDSKRSNMTSSIAKESVPLPPVALALPLEPASVAGPPSPARGSAGMPPPPSPAGAVYQPAPAKTPTDTMVDCKPGEEKVRRKARVGKTMVKNNLINSCKQIQQDQSCNQNQILQQPNTMLLMCHNPPNDVKEVKREVESPEELNNHKNERIPTNLIENSKTEITEEPVVTGSNQHEEKDSDEKTMLVQNDPVIENLLECQKLEGEDHKDQIIPEESTPTRRKSVDEEEITSEEINDDANQNLEEKTTQTPTKKRKLSLFEIKEDCDEGVKPKKPKKTVTKSSYKDLIKKAPRVKKLYSLSNKKKNGLVKNNGFVKTPTKVLVKKKKVKRKIENEDKVLPTKKQKLTNKEVLPIKEQNTNEEIVEPLKKLLIKKQKSEKPTKSEPNNNKNKLKCEEVLPTNNNKKQKVLPIKEQKVTKINGSNTNCNKTKVTNNKKQNDQLENTESKLKNQNKSTKVKSIKTKKLAPEILDSLFTKNNVDRTIESVILNSVILYDDENNLTSKRTPTINNKNSEKVLSEIQDSKNNSNNNKNKEKPSNNVLKTVVQDKCASALTQVQVTGATNNIKTGASKRKNKTSVSCNNVVNNGVNVSIVDGKINNKSVVQALAVPKIPRRSTHTPRWSNGWSWEGDSYQGKIFLNTDQDLVVRTCYPAMRHMEGDLITPRDSVLLKAGPRKIDLPFVAKVAALWENPDDGEMMMSLLWYYRPEHTEQGRQETDQQDEVFASRHKDTNSVACIEDKCYVLTFNEYCRYRKTVRRIEEGLESTGPIVPLPDGGQYHRAHRQPPASPELALSPDLVFFCRRVYDFRQKRLVKNPS